MEDKLLMRFHTDNRLHRLAIDNAKEKGMKLSVLNTFAQPEAWDILTEMIANGEYHTKPTKICYIDKNDGKSLTYEQAHGKRNMENVREIFVMEIMDRVIWNMFYQICYERFNKMIHPLCKSYKKGESTRTTARELSKSLASMPRYEGTKNDLSKFFDSVPIEVIDKQLDIFEKEEPSAIWKPIREFYHDNRVIENGKEIEREGSLKQGCAFACLLADVILSDIDEEMTKYDVVYYRYSDDFILLGRQQYKAYQVFQRMLKAKGLTLNPKKTEFINHLGWFTFLGFMFKGDKVTVSKKTLKNIRHKIKSETIYKVKQLKRPLNKRELKKAIDNIQYYFFVGCDKLKNGGMAPYLYGACNVMEDILKIDEYIKDCIRAAYTNKCNIYGLGSSMGANGITHGKGKNVRMNRTKAYELPRELGWYSLNHMYNKYRQGKAVYSTEVNRMRNGEIIEWEDIYDE